MQAFRLVEGRYQRAELTERRLVIPEIELSLGLWRGSYEDIEHLWLRWMTVSGDLIPLPTEELAAAQQRAEKLAARLRELGIDPEQL